jgi:imidazoleglycerol phosphate dehydratase HisB
MGELYQGILYACVEVLQGNPFFEHMIKALAHKGGVRIGKTPKKLVSICCP